MENCCDYLNTQISINGGSWFSLSSLYGSETWDLKTFDLSGYVNNGDILNIRFEFTSDGSVTYDGVSIDNFLVTGVDNSTPWYDLPVKSGTVPAMSSSVIDVQFYSNGLLPGTYNDVIQISSNDPLNPIVLIPCAFTVENGPTAPLSVSATETEIPQGSSTTLIYTGGSGATFNWYSGLCGGTFIGTGNNLKVYPTATTTYYGRWEKSCQSSACKAVTIKVNINTSVNELEKMGVKIYPNPADGKFIIEVPEKSTMMKLIIQNMEGKTILNKSYGEVKMKLTCPMNHPVFTLLKLR